MTSPRVEPPEELRGRDGWHWLARNDDSVRPHKWLGGAVMCWLHALSDGWRYASPCLTPTEVAALRVERDAIKAEAAQMGYIIHGPLLPEQEARALRAERDAAVARAEELASALDKTTSMLEVTTTHLRYWGKEPLIAVDRRMAESRAALAAYRAASPEAQR